MTHQDDIAAARDRVVEAAAFQARTADHDLGEAYNEACASTNCAARDLRALTRPPTAREVVVELREWYRGCHTIDLASWRSFLKLLDSLEARLGESDG